MARVAGALLAIAVGLGANEAAAALPTALDVQLAVDLDDDDGDGVADADQAVVSDRADCASFESSALPPGLVLRSITPPSAARVLADGASVQPGQAVPSSARTVAIQALASGSITIDLGGVTVRVRAIRLIAIDGEGKPVSMATSHASMQRTVPDRIDAPTAITRDPDALRYVVAGRAEDLPASLRILSRTEKGTTLQSLPAVRLLDAPCPSVAGAGMSCRTSAPIRVVGDDVDQTHPLVAERSIRGELGGGLLIDAGSGRRQQIRIGGPRQTRLGPIRRYRAALRARLMRVVSHGAPPVGGRDGAALSLIREQIRNANSLWGQCGISFGPPDEADVQLVDPPAAMMIGIGCDLGMPASGGELRLQVEGRNLTFPLKAGSTPSQVARLVERGLTKAGFRVVVSPNARIGPGGLPTVDLLVRRKDGAPATVLGPARGPVSTDATMGVCVGRADLSSGLRHFFDVDSMAGTFEERVLLKSVDDHDPSTIDLLVIAAFARGGRIGESFIGNDRSSLRNIVVIDRAGVRVARASFTLAHEAGHVLLDVPGHPDDYGTDTPTLLMDSDGADLSAFGPRRLLVAECERALEQSGPQTPMPVLRAWEWGRLAKEAVP